MADAPKKKVLTAEEKAARFEAAKKMTSELVDKSEIALKEFSTYTQAQVDKIVAAMALAGSENSLLLAHEAHDETGRGVVEDKDTKNRFASESVYNAIKNDKTVGVISEDRVTGKVELAAPLGILAGIVPTTNPTSTTIFKSMLAAKTRNTIVFAFHPQA
ncbi:bifunctional acetaldehyde-CoA/alcohol dehydrogenase, partial [Weissella cibaria]|nr:bifunctional acetaldehyde-CoA/alcohol dehydrogenase [Weissella cibaria]MBU7562491.1 bifunctional acetaldehyde-CoA/alcohol dehydrogenase [Weissella cibaria]